MFLGTYTTAEPSSTSEIATPPARIGDYCNINHDGITNPCRDDRSDYCCNCNCDYCGPLEYCNQLSPFGSHCGVCNPEYQGGVCLNHYEVCSDATTPNPPTTVTAGTVPTDAPQQVGPYCNVNNDGSDHPCQDDRSDFCCNYACDYCGPQAYCEQFSPFMTHAGVCNPDYAGAPLCLNHYELCEASTVTGESSTVTGEASTVTGTMPPFDSVTQVIYNGKIYGTLSGQPVAGQGAECQNDWQPVPSGCRLVRTCLHNPRAQPPVQSRNTLHVTPYVKQKQQPAIEFAIPLCSTMLYSATS